MLRFDETNFQKYTKDDTQFPMNIFTIKEKFVFNIEKMYNWMEVKNLREEFNSWRLDGKYHPAKKDTANPIVQLRDFITERHNDIQIPSAELFDHVPIKADEEQDLYFSPNNELELALSGGRSRKKRRQYRIKKSRSCK